MAVIARLERGDLGQDYWEAGEIRCERVEISESRERAAPGSGLERQERLAVELVSAVLAPAAATRGQATRKVWSPG